MHTYPLSKFTQPLPGFQIRRTVKSNRLMSSQRHHPRAAFLMPNNFWIPEISNARIRQDRIPIVLGPGFSFIGTVGDALVLMPPGILLLKLRMVMGKNGY